MGLLRISLARSLVVASFISNLGRGPHTLSKRGAGSFARPFACEERAMPNSTPTRQRQPPNQRPEDDAWTDDVADRVQALLREEGLELELVVFYDSLTEVLHAVGYDGAPARFFASYPAPSDSAGPAHRADPSGTGLPRAPCPSGGEGGSGVLGPRSRGTRGGPVARPKNDNC